MTLRRGGQSHQRHSGKWADTRARGVEIAAQGGVDWHARAQHRHRTANPVRVAAGMCPSCDGPIDAVTGECRCSA